MLGEEAGRLVMDGLSVGELADRFGTPLYLYSARALRDQLAALRTALGAVEVLYSLKANPNPALARVLAAEGAGLDVASLGELEIAQRAGVPGARITFAGPGKTDEELEAAITGGLLSLNVESANEGRRADRIATRLGRRVDVSLRINPSDKASSAGLLMGGTAAPFGVDEELAAGVLGELDQLAGLRLIGVHLYRSTQVLDAAVAASTIASALRTAGTFAATLGRAPELISVGPGLGVPLFESDRPLDLTELQARAHEALSARPVGARVLIESGRFLVADCGLYVATVLDVKVSRGTRFFVLDGGMHHHVAAAGGFGNLFRRAFPIEAVEKGRSAGVGTPVGPCCTPLDELGRDLPLGDLAPGDRIAVRSSGAYGLSASPILFLSHPTPAEVLVDAGEARLIRRRVSTAGFASEP